MRKNIFKGIRNEIAQYYITSALYFEVSMQRTRCVYDSEVYHGKSQLLVLRITSKTTNANCRTASACATSRSKREIDTPANKCKLTRLKGDFRKSPNPDFVVHKSHVFKRHSPFIFQNMFAPTFVIYADQVVSSLLSSSL